MARVDPGGVKCAVLLLAVAALFPGGNELGRARLALEAGSADLVVGGAVRSLTRRSPPETLPADAYLEAGASSRLTLRWPEAASLTLTGPAALELAPGPRLTLVRCRTAELEVRRGQLRLELPGCGSLALEAGAVGLSSLPDGRVELTNRGGSPLVVRAAGEPAPRRLAPGRTLRLGARPRP